MDTNFWTPGHHLINGYDQWVTAYPELMQFCFQHPASNQLLRLKQVLGLPASSQNDTIVEFWVSPDYLFRPTPEPAINSVSAGLSTSSNAPLISPNLRIPPFWPAWYNRNYLTRDYAMVPSITNGYPFTQLGYTYDWGSTEPNHFGLSEFIIPSGTIWSNLNQPVPIDVELPIAAEKYGTLPFPVARDGLSMATIPGPPFARIESNHPVKIGDGLSIKIYNLPPERLPQFKQAANIVLILDGNPFTNLCANSTCLASNSVLLHFNLTFNAFNRPLWSQILQKPSNIQVQLQASENPPQVIECDAPLDLIAKDRVEIWLATGLFVLFAYVVLFLAARTALIRDPSLSKVMDEEAEKKRKKGVSWVLACATVLLPLAIYIATCDRGNNSISSWAIGFTVAVVLLSVRHFTLYWATTRDAAQVLPPYSLARTQMAIWFFLVVCSWVFLWLLTGTFNSLSNTVLILMGIGAGTALGAEAQNATKPTAAEDLAGQIKALTPGDPKLPDLQRQYDAALRQPPPKTVNFFEDVLTDSNGMSFHRFQMFVWTILLSLVFVVEVWQHLTMPDFDNTLLALMGISSGTYLGFMINEPHSSVDNKTSR
jgi:hypothetical protein